MSDSLAFNNSAPTRDEQEIIKSSSIELGLDYLEEVIRTRLSLYFNQPTAYSNLEDIPSPEYNSHDTLGNFIQINNLDKYEQIILMMALAPHLKGNFYDEIIEAFLPAEGEFPQFGGTRGKQFRGILPTGETLLFILGGQHIPSRLYFQGLLDAEHPFVKQHIVYLDISNKEEPRMSGRLIINQDYVELFTTGKFSSPQFSIQFPAQKITTDLDWEDLVLDDHTHEQILELQHWINNADYLLNNWGLRRKVKKGYRALFYGPPGTGKTLTASLLGKYTGREVYKIDLSMIVSKYIGETEKNLSQLFAKSEDKEWILFFDEADSLFSKRTGIRDAHDKYANQEVSYLLQRVENYNGMVILASNFKSNIDDAFIRRFQSIIYFPIPNPQGRLTLWKKSIPSKVSIGNDVNLDQIAQKYELTGSNIMNIVYYCCLQLAKSADPLISHEMLKKAIQRELRKEGKMS